MVVPPSRMFIGARFQLKTPLLTLFVALSLNLVLVLRNEAHNSLDLAFTEPKIHLPISESSRPIGLIFGGRECQRKMRERVLVESG
ncbi:hypothetical protein COLO4_04663 [Corchorus olitorius]|uniref:Uncharacterized protein n=1 Tax=Corchorus olitorius TaxID=93759 RepID=A0A1R3KTA3_9ROSI|nr:hypothetical protein COLO4_04663 [Corchorus olitorius]